MTRAFYPEGTRTWGMFCDNRPQCDTVVGPRPTQADLPLLEFVAAGWFIADVFGDRCPECVAKGDVPNAQEWPR